jgi:carbon-monoxide dehydrogenase large subunit
MQYIGKSVTRVDSFDKVTGRAVYGFDVNIPGMLYGATLRSPLAHAGIAGIHTAEAKHVPGVRAVVTGKEFPFTIGMPLRDRPFLAIDRARYAGEPVAAVAAETELAAHTALKKIRVEYEELPAVFDPREALQEEAPLVHPDVETYPRSGGEIFPGTNIRLVNEYALGDMEAGFREADEIFENEFIAHPVGHTAMETHTAVARYSPSGGGDYTIWTSTCRPHIILHELMEALGISAKQARVIVPYTGVMERPRVPGPVSPNWISLPGNWGSIPWRYV